MLILKPGSSQGHIHFSVTYEGLRILQVVPRLQGHLDDELIKTRPYQYLQPTSHRLEEMHFLQKVIYQVLERV